MQAKQQGFTLVELIVVIVILGILAATALPKFIDVSSDARKGVMQGVEGAMRGANLMLYGKAAAAGKLNVADHTISNPAPGVASVVVDYGYAEDAAALKTLLDLNPSTDFAASTDETYIYHTGSKDSAAETDNSKKCRVTYAPVTTAGGAPTYTLASNGC